MLTFGPRSLGAFHRVIERAEITLRNSARIIDKTWLVDALGAGPVRPPRMTAAAHHRSGSAEQMFGEKQQVQHGGQCD